MPPKPVAPPAQAGQGSPVTRHRTFLGAIFFVLLVSTQSLKGLPWGPIWGTDFQNLFAFHHCKGFEHPYLASGRACGDLLGRDLFYPPFMYWAFAWTRIFGSFETAYGVWIVGLTAILAWTSRIWFAVPKRNALLGAIFGLVLLQYPTFFAIERGNNDAWVVLVWTLAFLAWRKGWCGTSGFFAGATALLKVYPVFSLLVIGAGAAGLAWKDPHRNLRPVLKWLGGLTLALLVAALLTGEASQVYFGEVLPRFAQTINAPGLANHAILPRFQDQMWMGYLLCAGLLLSWVIAARRTLGRDPALVFTGALAISTYFSNVSEDYNLVTTLPLLFLLLGRSIEAPDSAKSTQLIRGLTVVGFAAVFGHRQLFVGSSVYFQLACWVGVAVVVVRRQDGSNLSPPQ